MKLNHFHLDLLLSFPLPFLHPSLLLWILVLVKVIREKNHQPMIPGMAKDIEPDGREVS